MKLRPILSGLISYVVLPILLIVSSYAVAGHAAAEVNGKVPKAIIGKNTIKLEVASTIPEIRRGLMFRTSMPEDAGMVFIFHPEQEVWFWMKNTLIPLDMLFINDGKIVKISHSAQPCKAAKDEDCPRYPSDGAVKATEVLEVNGGYAQRHGIKEGDKISFEFPPAQTQKQQPPK